MYRATAFLTVLVLATATPSSGQESRLSTSLGGGPIHNLPLDTASALPRYSVFPEVGVADKLLSFGRGVAAPGAGVSWGYWNDLVEETSKVCGDCATYMSRAQAIGVRALLANDRIPIPVAGSAGLARHVVPSGYLGYGSSMLTEHPELAVALHLAEIGVRAALPVYVPLRIVGGVRRFYRLRNEGLNQYVEEEREADCVADRTGVRSVLTRLASTFRRRHADEPQSRQDAAGDVGAFEERGGCTSSTSDSVHVQTEVDSTRE